MRILIWFRNDLRLHDHEPLYRALTDYPQKTLQIVPAYCFDLRQFGKTKFGFAKTGTYRAQFLRESVADLRQMFQAKGGNLVIRQGLPETEIPTLVKALGIDTVYWHQEVTTEELAVERAVVQQLQALQVKSVAYWGATLYHPEDLPFTVDQLPDVFTKFRQQVESGSSIRAPWPSPKTLPPLPEIDPGELPTLVQLGLEPTVADERGVLAFAGGETAGLTRVQHYIWQTDQLKVYKETRNGMLGADYSSKFSPWLALGCLSPRQIFAEVRRYEIERVQNESTYWLIFELLWRDYFRFVCAKVGDQVFYRSGLRGLSISWQQDWQRFEKWTQGMTGFPLIDANMRELARTGFMSNRGRQNVASFLTKNLGIDWRMGAEWFESLLIDYDVCSNWGNWNYAAGVGNDPRGFRYFNIPKQSKDYDADGQYVKSWIPALKSLPPRKVHVPWTLDVAEQKRYGVRLGVDYPQPIVDLEKSVVANEKVYQRALEKKI